MIEDRLLRAVLYAERHLGDELTVEQLAREACISDFHFHRMFHYRTGEPVMEFVRRLRLEHAAYRLRSTLRAVNEIAREVGYASPDAFGRAFRARFGDTPTGYRARWSKRAVEPPHVPASPTPSMQHAVDVCVRRLRGWTMLCCRCMGPYQQAFRARDQLDAWMQTHALTSAGDARFGTSHDDPELVAASAIRYDACRVLDPEVARRIASVLRPPLHLQDMPAGDYATVIHHGPFHELGDAYRRLFLHWLPASGRYPAHAPVVERYYNLGIRMHNEPTVELLLPLESQPSIP
jgi:AraC family transcriptional regulator